MAVEEPQGERVQRREERGLRSAGERIAQRQRPVRGEFGHQPVGERPEPIILFRFKRIGPIRFNVAGLLH